MNPSLPVPELYPAPPAPPAAASATPAAIAPPAPRTKRRRRLRGEPVFPVTWDPIRLSLAALMLISIGRIHQQLPILAVFKPGILLTLVSMGLAVALPKAVRLKDLFKTWPVKRVAWIVGIAILMAPLGLNASASLTFLMEVYLPNIVFFALLVIASRNAGDARFLIGSYVASLAILVYLSLFVWGSRSFGGFERMASNIMYDANDLGTLFTAGLPLCLLFAQTSKGVARYFGYAVAAGGPATIALSGSRGGFIALIVTGVGLLAMAPRITWGRRFAIIGIAVAMMAAFAPEGYLAKMQTIINADEDYNLTSSTGRVEIWKRGLTNLAPRPLNGVGISNFLRAQWVNQQYTESGAPVRAMSPHNTFLQIAVDLGVPAALIFLSILYGGTIGLIRIRNKLPASWLRENATRRFIYIACSYLPVSFMGWAAGAFFVSHAYLPPFYILVAFFAGTLVLLKEERRKDRQLARG